MVGLWAFTAVAKVQSLAGELRSNKPHGVAKKQGNKTTHNLLNTTVRVELKYKRSPERINESDWEGKG